MSAPISNIAAIGLPPAETIYLAQIVRTLQLHLGDQLIGVYLFGSAAYGEYQAGTSDLDVQAVVTSQLSASVRQTIAAALSHQRLLCPARRLEFVVYARPAIDPAARHPQFDLNFNTGSDTPDRLTLDPGLEASHWFLLDIAMGRALGRALIGPAPAQVFATIPRLWCLEAIADSLTWHHAHESASANSVLNACRGWRYAVTDRWGSKRAGAAWARQQPDCPPIVVQAEQLRQGGLPLSPAAASALTEIAAAAVQTALDHEQQAGPTLAAGAESAP